MKYLSVCSGIEAATVAWHPLGWTPVAFSEVDAFPSAVLRHHYPHVPNWGDMTRFHEWPDAAVDVLVGGTPCQSFSVAGLRKGLADPRGNLALTFLAIADRYRPRWVVWENVPGVLSSDSHDSPDPCPPTCDLDGDDGPADGTEIVVEDEYDADEVHAFACLLAGFSELGYFGAYGTLDAQYAGLAQRRKRVFAVFHLGSWSRAAAVLFDRASLSGHPAPRREAGQTAPTVPSRRSAGGGLGTDFDCDGGLIAFGGNNTSGSIDVATACQAHGGPHGRQDFGSETFLVERIAHSLKADGFDTSEDGTGRGTPLVPCAFDARQSDVITYGNQCGPLDTDGHSIAVAFAINSHAGAADGDQTNRSHASGGPVGLGISEEVAYSLRSGRTQSVGSAMAVRRLTPRECERLQGFPDDYTLIPYRGKPAADGPRYKALGNSMAVPVMTWIGKRIQIVDVL